MPLNKGYVTIISPEDWGAVEVLSWHAHPSRERYYVASVNKVYDKLRKRKVTKTTYMHRYLLGLDYGGHGHHRDGRSMNNTRRNLVATSPSENMTARKFQNSTGFHGVRKVRNKYQARVTVRGTRFSLGTYDDPEDAARAVDRQLVEMLGPGSELNFPDVFETKAVTWKGDDPPF